MSQFNVNGISIYYELKGNMDSQETVVFLNGVMASTNSWDAYIPLLERANFKILVHDFKGQLRSDKPKGPYTFKEHASELKALMVHLNINDAHLIGTSYGGEVGMRFAIDYKDSIKSLVIINSVSEMDEKLKLMVQGWKTLAKGDPYDFFSGMAPTIYGNSFIEKNKAFLEKRAIAMKNVPKEYFTGQIELYDSFLTDVTMTDELNRINCPTLVICGEEDILKERKFSDIIVNNIKNSEYVLIPDCGHVTIFEKPETLKSLLLGFILKQY